MAARAGKAERPNILFIMADDLGYADLGCYGARHIRTPNLDRLAARGAKLEQGYANAPVCSATRTALITGRYQGRLRCGLEEPIGFNDVGMPPSEPTLPKMLRDGGYTTILVGKWHLGRLPNYHPLKSGYDRFYGIADGGADYFSHRLGKQPGFYEDMQPIEQTGYLTDLLADRAVGEIRRAREAKKPFFLSLHFTAPHWPWEGPEDAEVAKTITNPVHLDGGSLAKYAEMVESMDGNIGRVLAELEAQGIAENTIVVFTSDNGGERFSDTWPFIGTKTELLEGGIRTPIIFTWPGRVQAGKVSQQVMVSMDFVPTFLAAAGLSPPRGVSFDGQNLLDVLTGAPERPRTLFWRYKSVPQAAMREGDWKYLKINEREYLFNLAQDSHERANLKDREPQRLAAMQAAFAKWNATMLPYPPDAFSHSMSSDMADRFTPAPPVAMGPPPR